MPCCATSPPRDAALGWNGIVVPAKTPRAIVSSSRHHRGRPLPGGQAVLDRSACRSPPARPRNSMRSSRPTSPGGRRSGARAVRRRRLRCCATSACRASRSMSRTSTAPALSTGARLQPRADDGEAAFAVGSEQTRLELAEASSPGSRATPSRWSGAGIEGWRMRSTGASPWCRLPAREGAKAFAWATRSPAAPWISLFRARRARARARSPKIGHLVLRTTRYRESVAFWREVLIPPFGRGGRTHRVPALFSESPPPLACDRPLRTPDAAPPQLPRP